MRGHRRGKLVRSTVKWRVELTVRAMNPSFSVTFDIDFGLGLDRRQLSFAWGPLSVKKVADTVRTERA